MMVSDILKIFFNILNEKVKILMSKKYFLTAIWC